MQERGLGNLERHEFIRISLKKLNIMKGGNLVKKNTKSTKTVKKVAVLKNACCTCGSFK